MEKKKRPVKERFYSKVDTEKSEIFWNGTRCHEWTGSVRPNGYGEIGIAYKTERAHRVAWAFTNGEIPEGQNVLHRCDNRLCCNPEHLFLGSLADNVADMISKGRQAVGSRRWNAKLNDDAVREIRTSLDAGKDIAVRFGVSRATISEIRNGKIWVHA